MGSATLFIGLNNRLDLPLKSDQRPGKILDLFARIVDLAAKGALTHASSIARTLRIYEQKDKES